MLLLLQSAANEAARLTQGVASLALGYVLIGLSARAPPNIIATRNAPNDTHNIPAGTHNAPENTENTTHTNGKPAPMPQPTVAISAQTKTL